MLPSAGTELLDVLICDLLFDLNSASVPESGQLCPILKIKEPSFTIRTDPPRRRGERDRGERGENGELSRSGWTYLLFSMLKFFALVMDALMVLSRLSDGGILLYDGLVPSESMIASFM